MTGLFVIIAVLTAGGCLWLHIKTTAQESSDRRDTAGKPTQSKAKPPRDGSYGSDNMGSRRKRANPTFGRRGVN